MISDSHRHAPKQEAALATRLGGRVVAGSGAGQEKGDVRLEGLMRIECKCTQHKSFSITRKLVDKIEEEALSSDEIPAMVVEFLNGKEIASTVAVMPLWALETLINNQKE